MQLLPIYCTYTGLGVAWPDSQTAKQLVDLAYVYRNWAKQQCVSWEPLFITTNNVTWRCNCKIFISCNFADIIHVR